MTIYNDVFGGANIYPSEVTYSAISLSSDVTLSWPEETSDSSYLATRIIDVNPSGAGFVITLPAANKSGVGETILFNNVGASQFIVKDASGVQILAPTNGQVWQIYLTDNSTVAGIWKTLQYGASVSSANAAALAGTGIVAIGSLLSQSVPIITFSSSYSVGVTDRAKMFVWQGSGGTLTLPSPGTVGNNWFIYFKNSGSGSVTVDPSGSPTIDGSSTLSFAPNSSAIIATDGANYYTIGYGQSATFAFDYTSISVAGAGNYTLTSSELNRIAYKFTGVLTGNRNIIVPNTVQQYWINNQTTGAYTLTVKTAAGTGVSLSSGQSSIMYSDGTNVIDADSAGISSPVTVAQGGTGATTASAARINLGVTSIGDALFTAADAAAVWAALGNSTGITGGTF